MFVFRLLVSSSHTILFIKNITDINDVEKNPEAGIIQGIHVK